MSVFYEVLMEKKASISEELGENFMDGGISRRGRQEAELRLRRAGLSNAEVDRAMREMPSTGAGVLKSMGYSLGGGAAGGLAGAGLGALAGGKGGAAGGAILGGLGGVIGGGLLGSYKRYQTPIDRAERLIAEKKGRR